MSFWSHSVRKGVRPFKSHYIQKNRALFIFYDWNFLKKTQRQSCKIFLCTIFSIFRAIWIQRRGAQKNWGMFFEDIYLTCSRLTKLSIAVVLCTIAPIVIRRPISPRFFWLHLIWRGKPQKNCFHLHQLITPDQIVNALNTLNVIEI